MADAQKHTHSPSDMIINNVCRCRQRQKNEMCKYRKSTETYCGAGMKGVLEYFIQVKSTLVKDRNKK